MTLEATKTTVIDVPAPLRSPGNTFRVIVLRSNGDLLVTQSVRTD